MSAATVACDTCQSLAFFISLTVAPHTTAPSSITIFQSRFRCSTMFGCLLVNFLSVGIDRSTIILTLALDGAATVHHASPSQSLHPCIKLFS